jgi:rubrerythrin
MAKRFTKNVENFTCEHCDKRTTGTGFTNHCPNCLYSKHVDVNPGDRENLCGGMMRPVGLEIKRGNYVIIHRCQTCGFVKKNKTAPEDNLDAIIALAKTLAKKVLF